MYSDPTIDDSDPTIDDSDREGSDLLARIEELTPGDPTGNGWRPLLVACRKQIARLREWGEMCEDVAIKRKKKQTIAIEQRDTLREEVNRLRRTLVQCRETLASCCYLDPDAEDVKDVDAAVEHMQKIKAQMRMIGPEWLRWNDAICRAFPLTPTTVSDSPASDPPANGGQER
jgi:hypothetical protein